MLDAVLNVGHAYMCRSGEFLFRDGRGWDKEKVLRGNDVEVKEEEGQTVGTVFWRSSKADQ